MLVSSVGRAARLHKQPPLYFTRFFVVVFGELFVGTRRVCVLCACRLWSVSFGVILFFIPFILVLLGSPLLLEGYPGQHGPPGGEVQDHAASE